MRQLTILISSYYDDNNNNKFQNNKVLLEQLPIIYNSQLIDVKILLGINNYKGQDLSWIPAWIEPITFSTNNLMLMRNRLIEAAYEDNPDAFITQVDDDDHFYDPNRVETYLPHLRDDRLSFFMFRWLKPYKSDREWYPTKLSLMPNETFTFSNWGWIASVRYLVENGYGYPEFIEDGYLDDNYFHIKSYLINHEADFYMNPLYVWDNTNPGVSKGWDRQPMTHKIMNWYKHGNPKIGYKMDYKVISKGYCFKWDDSMTLVSNPIKLVLPHRKPMIECYPDIELLVAHGEPVRSLKSLPDVARDFGLSKTKSLIHRDIWDEMKDIDLDGHRYNEEVLKKYNDVYIGFLNK